MQILGGSITYCQGKSSSLGLLPLEKSSGTGAKDTSAAGECSTQDRLSIQPCLASSRVFHLSHRNTDFVSTKNGA